MTNLSRILFSARGGSAFGGQISGDSVDNGLGDCHSLRTAKSSEGSIRRKIRFPRTCKNREIRDVVAVIGMKHRPFQYCEREVGGAARITVHFNLECIEHTVIIESNFVLREDSVAFPGHFLVIVAEQPHLY